MKKLLRRIKFENIVAVVIAGSAVILAASVLYNVRNKSNLRNKPVDVLRNWSLTVDDTKVYRPGDTVSVVSKFEKLLNIKPKSSPR